MPPGERAIAGHVEQLRAHHQLADVARLHEAGAGVVGFVADDAIELGRDARRSRGSSASRAPAS